VLANQTPGFSGADLANLVNEGAILAARRNKKKIGMPEFEEAVDRVMLGPARKSKVMSAKEKEMVAYHEGGHALVAYYLKDFDLLHKITIVSRGMAGGYTLALPEEDRHLNNKSYFEKRIAYALGGLAAEELIYGEASTGASDDLQKATQIARAMVTRYGMSEKLGPRTFGRKEELVFLGREISEQRDYSEKIAEDIDEEVRRLIDDAHALARQLLGENRAKLDQLARRLIEIETLEGENLRILLEAPTDQDPPMPEDAPPPPQRGETAEEQEDRPVPQPRPGLAWGTGGVSFQLGEEPPRKD
jgi:cell division protease FtsH